MDCSARRIDSSDSNVSKYIFEFGGRNPAIAEAVLYKYPTYNERTVICCSTQSGCPVGCRFCGAGDAFVRSLTADEIVFQVDYLLADRDIDHREIDRFQIMFMSMGEPLLNFGEVEQAIRRLNAAYPRASLLISTSAPRVDYFPVVTLSRDINKVGLQFSVHEITDDARDKLIPFKAKLTLQEIARMGEAWHTLVGRKPFFNYCAHEGNTSHREVNDLYWLFKPEVWEATISVVCERDEHVAAANARQRYLATEFMEKLMRRGYSTRCFNPAGQDDIGGGCGQLHFVQQWFRDNPDKARPSIGDGLPVVHAPRPA